ncbi:MAG TPA: hypothetical protein DET40_24545 [Lentisphaeria bacterium]|nr:MAG: hypothetical protein A2X45_22950 [Lentisphaerae bacterium GWF2_50_93]HCE46729.1 hypothetical protein [Lentisphaeria bacterium]
MKSGAKKNQVQEKACSKAECKIPGCSKEKSLEKLAKSGKLEEFIKKSNGSWNHQSWLELCADISLEGYEPIDYDQVGVLLEERKAIYLSNLKQEDVLLTK